MKKNNNVTSFIVVVGLVVVSIFTTVLVMRLLPNNESNSYYVKVEDEMGAKIEALDNENQKLKIITSGDASKICVKSTETTPDAGNLCFKEIINNESVVSVYKGKRYYVWVMDTKGNVSNPMNINTDE